MPFQYGVDFQDKVVFSLPGTIQKRVGLWWSSTGKCNNSRNHYKYAHVSTRRRTSYFLLSRVKQVIIISHLSHLCNI